MFQETTFQSACDGWEDPLQADLQTEMKLMVAREEKLCLQTFDSWIAANEVLQSLHRIVLLPRILCCQGHQHAGPWKWGSLILGMNEIHEPQRWGPSCQLEVEMMKMMNCCKLLLKVLCCHHHYPENHQYILLEFYFLPFEIWIPTSEMQPI